jgi:hypothetical protein
MTFIRNSNYKVDREVKQQFLSVSHTLLNSLRAPWNGDPVLFSGQLTLRNATMGLELAYRLGPQSDASAHHSPVQQQIWVGVHMGGII